MAVNSTGKSQSVIITQTNRFRLNLNSLVKIYPEYNHMMIKTLGNPQ